DMDRDRGSELPAERVAGGVPEPGSRRSAESGRTGAQAAPGAELRMEQLRGGLHANERAERQARQAARRDRKEIEGAIQGQAPVRRGRLTRPRSARGPARSSRARRPTDGTMEPIFEPTGAI